MGSLIAKDDPKDILTEKEIRELEHTFNMFDDDKSGSIEADELGQVMKALGQNPTPDELEIMLRDVDTDGSGSIELNEFITMMAKRSKGYEKEVKMAFKVFNSNGYITAKEVKWVFDSIGEKITPKQISQLLNEAGTDDEGRISYKKFSKLMKGLLEASDEQQQKKLPQDTNKTEDNIAEVKNSKT